MIYIVMILLVLGTFFMFLAALGLMRMPDFYNRMHAAAKGGTLGLALLAVATCGAMSLLPDASIADIVTKSVLIIAFQFVAAPVGAHMLAKAAHREGCPLWPGTIHDDLDEDKRMGGPPSSRS